MKNEDFDYEEDYYLEEDSLGLKITSGKLVLTKDDRNMVGISIGGGYPNCPCVYVVQIFDGTPAAKDGILESGDEITAVNNKPVKGKTKNEVVRAIQNSPKEVILSYNKLHAEQEQGNSLDIVLKKVKHRIVEHMSSSTADSLGLSRAILCNDTLVKKLQELERNADLYRGLIMHIQSLMKHYFELFRVHKQLGDVFSEIAVRESLERANNAFHKYGETHRNMAKTGVKMLKILKPILADLGTFLNKAIPDTELTVQKYADAKFEYLSYCLKVKEMDDEEVTFNQLQESLYRVETGNYEYRLVLRCRQLARSKFSKLRSDVSIKLDLLDRKHIEDILFQLQRFVAALCRYNEEAAKEIKGLIGLFPVEMDLKEDVFQYKQNPFHRFDSDDLEEGARSAVPTSEAPALDTNIIDLDH
ncbi:PRKCA-binding protein-like isoform X2 [Paramacrobiotus metropolitanus]|uniref:PRKCA-binding protein-like isoform X2 n=1 Tax=Paramacrobiotus metropolitanus TaxID=2943436 RepID=UPI002446107E|nr:PRKCA-binding protein-like isoform X2 [Paramacrobiotus metropolitanus]